MLYILYGNDFDRRTAKVQALLSHLKEKRPQVPVYRFRGSEQSLSEIEATVGGRGLFDEKYVVILSEIALPLKESPLRTMALLFELLLSDHIGIITEEEFSEDLEQIFKEKGAKVQAFKYGAHPKKQVLTPFALTDAFVRGDTRNIWIEYQRLLMADLSPDEIHGALLWQVHTLLLLKGSETQGKGIVSPYTARKCAPYLTKHSREHLLRYSLELINMYHRARQGEELLEYALERFLLTHTNEA